MSVSMQMGSSDLRNVYSCTRKMRTIVKCGVGSTVHCHCPSMLCVCKTHAGLDQGACPDSNWYVQC